MNIWEQSFEDLRRPYFEEGKRDNDLANNYPPYDKVTRGDIIAGAKGADEMGGKNKEAVKKNRMKSSMKEEQEKKETGKDEGDKHKEYTHAPGKEEKGEKKTEKEMKKEHSDWRSDLGFFTEEDCGCDGPMKPKKGIKNKITINPDIKVNEENLNEAPGDGYIGNTPIPNPIRLAQDAVDAYNRKQQKTVDAVNAALPGSASMSATYFNKEPSAASKKYLGLQNSYQPEGDELEEVAPPGAEYERMIKHVKKNYPKEKEGIAYATAWKQYNKAKNEEFAGNYEGPLYAPHPDIEEAYKEIDREKENKMYRRAGNLARTALSSKGKKKEDAMKKSSNIVSAITRQKERERFDRIGQSPKHNEALENELDYYLGEALRPASERMKRVQTDAGRKKQEKERERKSKLEAEADKILAGFSKKGTGLAKTKPMSEQEDKERRGTDYMGRDYGTGKQNKTIPPEGVMQGGWLEREKKKKKSN